MRDYASSKAACCMLGEGEAGLFLKTMAVWWNACLGSEQYSSTAVQHHGGIEPVFLCYSNHVCGYVDMCVVFIYRSVHVERLWNLRLYFFSLENE